MLTRVSDWIGRHRRIAFVTIVALVALVVALGFALEQEYSVNQSSRSQTDQLLNQFLAGDTSKVVAGGTQVAIRMQNVRFEWSDHVYIDTGNMAVRAVPVRGAVVDFDDLESFRLEVQQSVVEIRPDVLAGMFNESVFNYPGSRIRDLQVSIVSDQTTPDHLIKLDGKINVVAWVPFTMFARLSVDTKTNTMVITVDHLKVFHVFPATKLIRWTPLQLDRLIALPPNQSLMVVENRLMVKPFGLFPPPRINGRIAAVKVDDHVIRITFAGDAIPAPQSTASNYVYLRGGLSQFGHLRMADTNILILDKNPANPFTFSLMRYTEMMPHSDLFMPDMKTVRITMPDL